MHILVALARLLLPLSNRTLAPDGGHKLVCFAAHLPKTDVYEAASYEPVPWRRANRLVLRPLIIVAHGRGSTYDGSWLPTRCGATVAPFLVGACSGLNPDVGEGLTQG